MKFEKFIERLQQQKETMLAVLVDPDKFNPELIRLANTSNVSCFLVGGSVLKNGTVKKVVDAIKIISSIPVAGESTHWQYFSSHCSPSNFLPECRVLFSLADS